MAALSAHPVGPAMMSDDEAPQRSVAKNRQGHGAIRADIVLIGLMNGRNAAIEAETEIKGFPPLVPLRHKGDGVVVPGRYPSLVGDTIKRARLRRDIACGKPQPHEGLVPVLGQTFADNFPIAIELKAIDNHPFKTRNSPHRPCDDIGQFEKVVRRLHVLYGLRHDERCAIEGESRGGG